MKYKSEWFNDESFWQYFAPVMFDNKRWAEVPAVLDAVTHLSMLNLYSDSCGGEIPKKAPSLVDLCCGPGRISSEAARRGWNVCGVDITESYLAAARSDAENEKLKVEYLLCDVRDFIQHEKYNAAVNLYNSFGYFEKEDDDFLFIKNAYNALKKGGAFIMELLGKEVAVRDFIQSEWFYHSSYIVLTEYTPLDSWTRLKNRWILLKDGKQIERTFIQRMYAASELRALFFKAGFSAVEIFGAWDESPYDHNANTLIVVGRK